MAGNMVGRIVGRLVLAAGMAAALLPGMQAGASDLAAVPMVREGSAAAEPWQRYRGWPTTRWDGFNALDHLDRTPPAPGLGQLREVGMPGEGDPEKGRELAFSRKRGGGCLACHVMGPKTPELPGNVGPDLSGIGSVGHADAYLFNYIYDPRAFNPDTVMLPWGAHGYYTEDEIRHIVAFLKTLTRPTTFANPLDDPAQRPLPVEDRDWTDPFINPAAEVMETGRGIFERPGSAGPSCASCHAEPGAEFRRWAVTMPKFDPAMDKAIGIEEFVFRHGAATTGERMVMQGEDNTRLSIWLRTLANGEPFAVDVDTPGAKAAFERGRDLTTRKIGQANLACIDCHSAERGANAWIRGQWLGESRGQIPHFPVWRTSRNEIWDIRKRLQWCNVQIRANDLPPDAPEYADLELYLSALSNGLPMESPGIRH